MPCRSDYMEPNNRERQLQETAQLLGYVLVETDQPVPGPVADAANNIYCATDLVPDLCRAIREMDQATFDRIVYNARDPRSRRLADWWERHDAADQARVAAERAATKRQALIERTWTDATQTVWPRSGDYASVSAESITKFAQALLDTVKK